MIPYIDAIINGTELIYVNFNLGNMYSNISCLLQSLFVYCRQFGRLPEKINTEQMFANYNFTGQDIYDHFYKITNDVINQSFIDSTPPFDSGTQFISYKDLEYEKYTPFIKKYFYPSEIILQKINFFQNEFQLNPENICVLFYRGNDKSRETAIPSYEEVIDKAKQIQEQNPNVVFLIQSDETDFINRMSNEFPNSFHFGQYISHMNNKQSNCAVTQTLSRQEKYEFVKNYVAITMIMAKCKHIICTSGNCTLWILLYREGFHNVHQYLNGLWIE